MNTSYRQVLVHVDATRAAPHRFAAALAIARNNDAPLAALYAVAPAFMELPYAPELGPSLAAELVAIDQRRRDQALRMFDELARGSRPPASWAQVNEVPIADAFAQQALYADLLVLGQHERTDAAGSGVPADFVESVLAASGRPAVVLPFIGASAMVGDTVAIAWKPTAEAMRAVVAALPFLQQARRVHVLTWGDAPEQAIGGARLDLASWLHAHGVDATWHRGGPEPERIGELLLSRVFDLGADLLVMGCYGHSRAREWILGGVTRTVLASMTLPVLMAH
jgi:nucleotide-binding universal stress UspA family protein